VICVRFTIFLLFFWNPFLDSLCGLGLDCSEDILDPLRHLGLGFMVGVQGLGFMVRVSGSGFRVQGLGFRVQGLGIRD